MENVIFSTFYTYKKKMTKMNKKKKLLRKEHTIFFEKMTRIVENTIDEFKFGLLTHCAAFFHALNEKACIWIAENV